eukprot:1152440-Pelagomonas_calceolata.AAC.7
MSVGTTTLTHMHEFASLLDHVCRYYYAVAECDSAATAAALYDACDGAELGRGTGGGCKLDLRFVPKVRPRMYRAVCVYVWSNLCVSVLSLQTCEPCVRKK